MAIPPIFLTAFSYEKNIQSWGKVGAVPFTRECLRNECERREVDDGCIDNNGDLKLEQDLEGNCMQLDRLGYMGDALRLKIKRQADHLLQWLPETATAEERVKAIVKGGINMSSIFYNIGPSCLSTDEMFQSLEYKDLLSKYNKAVGAHKILVGHKEI